MHEGGISMLASGDRVPDLAVEDENGSPVRLASLPGPTVLFFFPKADTPG